MAWPEASHDSRPTISNSQSEPSTWHGSLVNEMEMRPLQLAQLRNFDYFVRLAGQHQLRYYIIGGSLLGAVRHNGFIPWDDDIDVALPRPDFDRLSSIMQDDSITPDDASVNHTWTDYRTNAAYPWVFAKLGLSGTRYYEYRIQHLALPHTVAIDVFPLDGVPSGRTSRSLHRVACRLLQLRISDGARRSPTRATLVRLLTVIPRSWAIRAYEVVVSLAPYNSSSLVANLAGISGYVRNIMPKSWFEQADYLMFEGRRVSAPGMWHQYLQQIYQDYMRLPPESERTSHHNARWDLEAEPHTREA